MMLCMALHSVKLAANQFQACSMVFKFLIFFIRLRFGWAHRPHGVQRLVHDLLGIALDVACPAFEAVISQRSSLFLWAGTMCVTDKQSISKPYPAGAVKLKDLPLSFLPAIGEAQNQWLKSRSQFCCFNSIDVCSWNTCNRSAGNYLPFWAWKTVVFHSIETSFLRYKIIAAILTTVSWE